MAFRSDISVDWTQSPRIVTIASPSTEVTIQDLYDTLRFLEERPGEGLPYPYIVDTAGKQDLGGGVLVGLTMTLRNARIAFQGRKTSVVEGSTITTADTNGVTLTDSNATFISSGVTPGAWVINLTDGSRATVLKVSSETVLITDGLGDGVDNQFGLGDSYEVQNVTQCNVTGGNLVAIDSVGASISPILPTVGTQIVQANSSSATQLEQLEIRHASFDGAVHIDPTLGVAGTDYPRGTQKYPVNNLADAITISQVNSLDQFHLHGSITIPSGTDVSDYKIVGNNPIVDSVTAVSGSTLDHLYLYNLTVSGSFAGGQSILFERCHVDYCDDVTGFFQECFMENTVVLQDEAHFLNCWGGRPGDPIAQIDVSALPVSVAVRNWNGQLRIASMSNPNGVVTTDFNSGRLILDNTCVSGSVTVRGVCDLVNNSNGTTVTDLTVANRIWQYPTTTFTAPNTAGAALLSGSSGNLTPAQETMLLEMYNILGLDPTKPLLVTSGSRKVPIDGSEINQVITEVTGTVVVQRV